MPKDIKKPTVPLITIPTSLSGGEYFALGGATDDIITHHKQGFLQSGMGANLVILDPELCLTTPEYHWLSTGVRSIDHCVEAICSLESTLAGDDRAEQGLKLLVPALLKCKANSNDTAARFNCQLAVHLAMWNVRAGIPMGGSHAIGHQLGMYSKKMRTTPEVRHTRVLIVAKIGPLGVAHGVTSCIMCPAVMKYNIQHGSAIPDVAGKQKKVRDILWSEPDVAKLFQEAGLTRDGSDLGDLLDVVIRALGLPRTLHELDISKDVIPALSKRTLDDFWAASNPIPLTTPEQVQEILEVVA